MADDELALPFIFVADGADPPPELAAFRSAHPDWVSFPATFIPHEPLEQEGDLFWTQSASEQAWEPPRRKKPPPPQPTRTDLSAALRAFQRASVEHPDPVAAMRALRDSPKDFDDQSARQAGAVWGNASAAELWEAAGGATSRRASAGTGTPPRGATRNHSASLGELPK